MVKALHREGIEVILDVVYNHTAEGNHLGPDAVVQGRRQQVLLPARPRRPALLHGLHGHGQLAQRRPPERAADDHGLAALLGDRVPRRRLPLRPRERAGARALRRRPAERVLRHDPPGPRALAGQADRRAVGRRPGRLPGRQLPRAVERVERHLPRRDARLLARRRRASDEFAARFTGSSDLYDDDGRDPFASINFITAHDGFTLRDLVSYNEKHNEANLEDNRDGTDDNRSWNCGVEGPTDDPEIIALRRRQQRNFLATLLLSPGHADAARRRRVRPHAGRQQQRLVPGLRDLLVRLGRCRAPARTCWPSRARLIRCAATIRSSAARDFLAGEEHEGSGLPDAWWFRPDGHKMTAQGLGARRRHVLGMFLNGEEIPRPRPARRARSSTTRSCCCSTPTTRTCTFTLPVRALRRALGARAAHGRPGRRARRRSPVPARGEVDGAGRSMIVLQARHDGRRSAPPTGSSSAPDLDFARRARARALPARPRASATSTSRRPCRRASGSTHGYDVVDPTRVSDALGGEDGLRALRRASRASGSSSTSSPTTWAPATRTAGGPTRSSARGSSTSTRRRAATGASSTSTTSPAVRLEHEDVFELTHAQGARARARRRGRRPARRPPRRPRRPRRLPAAAARRAARRTSGSRRSCTRASRCATGPSTAPSATSSSTTRRRCSSTRRPRRRSPTLWTRARRRRAAVRRASRSRPSSSRRRRRSRARSSGCGASHDVAGHRRRARARCRSTGPTSSRGAGASRTPTARRRRGRHRRGARARAAARGARPRRVRHPLPADLAAGDGQGRRGHRLLPLQPAARAQRGRRRPGALRHHASASSTRANARAPRASRTTC